MLTQQILHQITAPLVQTRIYKDEETALLSLVYELIENKLRDYHAVIQTLEGKHRQNFEQFTQAITQRATYADEEDWMEWKGAVEMTTAWKAAKQQVLSDERARRN